VPQSCQTNASAAGRSVLRCISTGYKPGGGMQRCGGSLGLGLPCSSLLMTCFADNNVSQGSVATYARFGGIADIHLTANLPRNLPVKKFFLIG